MRSAPGGDQPLEWLVLTHHLPTEPAYLRVKVRRRLERIGAVPLKNSVYVLPPTEDTQEDFEWLCQEIRQGGGETSLSIARFLDDETDKRLIAGFREARAADYAAITDMAAQYRTQVAQSRGRELDGSAGESPLSKLRRQLNNVNEIDFFDATNRAEAERAISEAERLAQEGSMKRPPGFTVDPPLGNTWVTRTGVKVDRIASAWLIRRFIDPAAVFKFVSARGYSPAENELRFDMFEGEFTHVGETCTFETLLLHFDLSEPALAQVAEIVHDVDCKDQKFARPEADGVSSVLRGLTQATSQDEKRIEMGSTVFEGLYEHFARSVT